MDNLWLSALTGLLFFATALHGSPLKDESDVITANEDGVVYVANVYAVKDVGSEVVGKMLSHHPLPKMPSMFEPIGSILVSSDETEPMNLNELSDFFEAGGLTVDKIDDEDDPKVIELELQSSELYYMFTSIQIQMYLQSQGIIINMNRESSDYEIQIEFDESVRDAADHEFTLEALGHVLESEGVSVEYKRYNGKVVSITIIINISSEESIEEIEGSKITTTQNDEKVIESKAERRIETNIGNEVELNSNKKMHNEIDNDDLDVPLDFITRSEAMNKIRRRRSACPECKAGYLIKQYINNVSGVH